MDPNGIPEEEPDFLTWCHWMGTGNRCIARAEFGNTLVSTVFIGLDFFHHPPLLFETMTFGADHYQERYATRTEALMGHKRACQMVNTRTDQCLRDTVKQK